MAHNSYIETTEMIQMNVNATYLCSQMAHGNKIDWFDVAGVVYGLSSRFGIINTEGFEIPMIDAGIALAIISSSLAHQAESQANIQSNCDAFKAHCHQQRVENDRYYAGETAYNRGMDRQDFILISD